MPGLADVLAELQALRSPDRWRTDTSDTCYADGIIGDTMEWFRRQQRVLFLAKEPNDAPGLAEACREDQGIPDLCKAYRERPIASKHRPRFERNLGRWAYAIAAVDAGGTADFGESTDNAHRALLRSAIVNLKKTGGTGKTTPTSIRSYAMAHRDLLRRQVELLKPTAIVCCGTVRFAELVWNVRIAGDHAWHEALFLVQDHPSTFRKSDSELFDQLVQRYQRAIAHRARSND